MEYEGGYVVDPSLCVHGCPIAQAAFLALLLEGKQGYLKDDRTLVQAMTYFSLFFLT